MKIISICVPIYNEEENINVFYYELNNILTKKKQYNFEIIFTDNNSTDKSEKIIEELRKIKEPYPYFRGLITEITNNIDTIEFDQPKRLKGNSKNNFFTLFDIGMLGIIKHSRLPLRFMTISGFLLSFSSLLIGLFFFTYKLLFWNSFQLGLAPLILGLFFGISVQVFMLGIIGEYVGFILMQTRQMPLVVEKERINF